MKKFVLVCLIVCLSGVSMPAYAAAKKTSQEQQLKLMSTFLSNFTELGFLEFDTKSSDALDTLHLGDPSNPDLIRFGIMHNYVNNYKSRIKKCPKKNCEYGSLVIEAKFVAESVKKYFDINLKHRSVDDSDPPYHFDGKFYHFEGADGEAVYYAEAKNAVQKGKTVHITGDIYNSEDKDDRPYVFEAAAKPYKWNGKDTWAVISMNINPANGNANAELMARTEGLWRLDGEKDTAYIEMDGKGGFKAFYASGALENSGTLEAVEEYEDTYFYLMRDESGKDLEMGFFMDSDTQLHFGNGEGSVYIKD